MTRFVDGPASGVTLYLKRAPMYLRAVCTPGGGHHSDVWDALDQLDDTPSEEEIITVYRRQGEATWIHINRRPRGGGVFHGGSYCVVDPQPSDSTVRSTSAWQAWVAEQAAAEGKKADE